MSSPIRAVRLCTRSLYDAARHTCRPVDALRPCTAVDRCPLADGANECSPPVHHLLQTRPIRLTLIRFSTSSADISSFVCSMNACATSCKFDKSCVVVVSSATRLALNACASMGDRPAHVCFIYECTHSSVPSFVLLLFPSGLTTDQTGCMLPQTSQLHWFLLMIWLICAVASLRHYPRMSLFCPLLDPADWMSIGFAVIVPV